MPREESNEAVVRRLFDAVNSGDDPSLDDLVAPDCEIIGPAGSGRGPDIYRQVFGLLRAAFPDHSFDVLTYHLLHAERTLRGTLFELSYRAEQLGRAAQPAFELSKGRTIVGDRRVPNIFVSDAE